MAKLTDTEIKNIISTEINSSLGYLGGQLSEQRKKSVEYYLECYKRSEFNCVDQFHILDFNFDTAIIVNSEQASGYLNLNIFPKNNITLACFIKIGQK